MGNAAFLASDRAGATTGTDFNLTSGTVVDLGRPAASDLARTMTATALNTTCGREVD